MEHFPPHTFYSGYLPGLLVVEADNADTTVKRASHLANESVLLLEEEGFVLEPVDETGQNLTGFSECLRKAGLFGLLAKIFAKQIIPTSTLTYSCCQSPAVC